MTFQPLFLPDHSPPIFAVHHRPQTVVDTASAVLILPSMVEENNRSRHIYAGLARGLARRGHHALILDVRGCGDSDGDHAKASWQDWQADALAGVKYLRNESQAAITLLGHRTGALLTAAIASDADPARLILWHPVTKGARFWQSQLRTRAANRMAAGAEKERPDELRRLLDAHQLEIGGYGFAPALVDALEAASLNALETASAPVDWIDVVPSEDSPAPPASQKQIGSWQRAGLSAHYHSVVGAQFWSLLEPEPCPALIELTLSLMEGRS